MSQSGVQTDLPVMEARLCKAEDPTAPPRGGGGIKREREARMAAGGDCTESDFEF